MFSLFALLRSFFKRLPRPTDFDEAYLAAATDIYDLERRMRILDQRRGEALAAANLGLSSR